MRFRHLYENTVGGRDQDRRRDDLGAVFDYFGLPPLPGARMWSKAMGPPPKKMRANARAANARGNSYPLLPINPL
jgi:hypothetical protein